MNRTIRIGTRGSRLALWQAHYVRDRLNEIAPDHAIELVEIETSGDAIRDVPLTQLGGLGAFTKEIQNALLEDRVDLAVHSLKDLPTFHVPNLILAAIPERGPIGDAFISKKHATFADMPSGGVIGTSSLRRRAQILHQRPDLNLIDLRGNVETRLRKLVDQDLDGIILAEAGLLRLQLDSEITEILDRSWILPAVGQGALGLECREDDHATREVVEKLNHATTRAAALAERSLLRGLGGGCQVPIGADTNIEANKLILRGIVINPEGTEKVEDTISGNIDECESLGQQLAEKLLQKGAKELLD